MPMQLSIITGKKESDKQTDKFYFFFFLAFALLFNPAYGTDGSRIEFTVSMENPNRHYFHVTCDYSGFTEKDVIFKLPVWTPGYYMIMDYPKYVVGFEAFDSEGSRLKWEKSSKNTWVIHGDNLKNVSIKYDVYAFRISVADSYLDDGRGFISPTGIFMHPEGKLNHPVTVKIIPYEKFSKVSTGLDAVAGVMNTFYANNYDVLYDCPILAGNQEILTFEVDGIPYTVAAEELGNTDRKKFIEDHRKIVKAAVSIIGEIPYRHYTFLIMHEGRGGLEHTNSMAVFSGPGSFSTPEGYKRWLDFIAHEFFHLYNVKTIRPIALGPFDYDRENYTTMLWFSEGVTSYYENIILNRAGIYSRDEVLRELLNSIAGFENIPGRKYQSAAQSSFDTWLYFLNRTENTSNTTISYYDKGCALGMLLDLKIRHETGNRKSLDDVMRNLYQIYYKGEKRGFTDDEFRQVCEGVAGTELSEIFDVYISTSADIDYARYLGYAGLDIDANPVQKSGAWLGITTNESSGNLSVTSVERDSPAFYAGLSARDVIVDINGMGTSSAILNEILGKSKPGDRISITSTHRNITNKMEVELGKNPMRSFEIKPLANPEKAQLDLLNSWLIE